QSFIAANRPTETLTNSGHQLIPNLAVFIEPLLTASLARSRIHCRPIFNLGCNLVCQFQGLVVRRRRQSDDEIEVQPFEVFKLLERDRLVAGGIDARFLPDPDRAGIELAPLPPAGTAPKRPF